MDRTRLDTLCEKGILGLMLAILVFGPVAMGGVYVWQFLILQGLTIAVMMLWGVRIWVSRKPQLLWPPICWFVLAVVAYVVARYFTSDIEYFARQELIQVLLYAFLFFAILNNLHRQESIQVIVLTLAFLGMLISGWALYQFVTGTNQAWGMVTPYKGRAGGTYFYPNALAGFLEMVVLLAASFTLISRLSHLMKILLGYATLMMLCGLGVTLCRGSWVAVTLALAALCVILLTQRSYRLKALVLVVGVGILCIGLIPRAHSLQARFQTIFSGGNADEKRVSIWYCAAEMWRDNFWFGVGPAQFNSRFPQYRPYDVQENAGYAHNDYLNTLDDWGLVGLILVLAVVVVLYASVFRNWKFARGSRDDFSRKRSSKFALMVGASLALFTILVHSFFDFNMHIPANAILAIMLMALLSSQWRFATERFWYRAGRPLQITATVILTTGALFFVWTGVRSGREYYWLRSAGTKPIDSHAEITDLEHAFQIENRNPTNAFWIGERYWENSSIGGKNYVELGKKALEWYRKAMPLNPHEALNWAHYGNCLDWIGAAGGTNDSEPYFWKALSLNANSFVISGDLAKHYIEKGDFAAARACFERSRRLESRRDVNLTAYQFLPVLDSRLKEAAERLK